MKQTGPKANPGKWLSLSGDILYQYSLRGVNDTAIAEDRVQETFLSALKELAGYKGEASEKIFSIF